MTKEELQKLVNESNSYREILVKQGKSISGAAIKLLKSTLDSYGIDTHLLYERKPHKHAEKIPLENLLVKSSFYDKKNLKRRLIEAGLKTNCCEKCGNKGEWNGEPLTIQLHHINGDRTDNRIENLQMLCPNCHSQTENHSGKNSGRKLQNYCKDCGKEIGSKSTYCTKCAAKRKNKPKVENKPSKEELLEMIKTTSFVEIGKKYGVSDKAITKWCVKYGLPSTRKEIKKLL